MWEGCDWEVCGSSELISFHSLIHISIHSFIHPTNIYWVFHTGHWRHKANKTSSTSYQTQDRSFHLGGVKVMNTSRIFMVLINLLIKHVSDSSLGGLGKSLHPQTLPRIIHTLFHCSLSHRTREKQALENIRASKGHKRFSQPDSYLHITSDMPRIVPRKQDSMKNNRCTWSFKHDKLPLSSFYHIVLTLHEWASQGLSFPFYRWENRVGAMRSSAHHK